MPPMQWMAAPKVLIVPPPPEHPAGSIVAIDIKCISGEKTIVVSTMWSHLYADTIAWELDLIPAIIVAGAGLGKSIVDCRTLPPSIEMPYHSRIINGNLNAYSCPGTISIVRNVPSFMLPPECHALTKRVFKNGALFFEV
eukprot:IDg12178t1